MLTAVKLCLTVVLMCQPSPTVWAIASFSGGCQTFSCNAEDSSETNVCHRRDGQRTQMACGCCRTKRDASKRRCCAKKVPENDSQQHAEIESEASKVPNSNADVLSESAVAADRSGFYLVAASAVLDGECGCWKVHHQTVGLLDSARQQDERCSQSCIVGSYYSGSLTFGSETTCYQRRVSRPQRFVQKQLSVWHL